MSVPVNWYDISVVPRNNGVRELSLDDYDDATRYPNIAVIRSQRLVQRCPGYWDNG